MTLIEIVFFLFNTSIAVTLAVLGWHLFGWLGMLAFAMVGFSLLPTVFYLLGKLLSGTGFPVCPNGAGGNNHYRYTKDLCEGEIVVECRCCFRFVTKGVRFMIVNEDGTLSPYMQWKRGVGWLPDETEEQCSN